MSISVNHTHVLDIKFKRIEGRPAADGFLFRIVFDAYRIHPMVTGLAAHKLTEEDMAEHEWHFSNPFVIIGIGTTCKFVGRAQIQCPIHIKPSYGAGPWEFAVDLPLTAAAVEEMEHDRNGGDLPWVLDIYGDMFNGHQWVHGYDRLRDALSQHAWINALNDAGYGTSLVFEIPLNIKDKLPVAKMDEALKRARRDLYSGDYRGVVAECRHVFEPLMPDVETMQRIRQANKDGREDMDKPAREAALFMALHDYTNLPHHNDRETFQEYTRKEALMVLGLTMGLVACHASRLANG